MGWLIVWWVGGLLLLFWLGLFFFRLLLFFSKRKKNVFFLLIWSSTGRISSFEERCEKFSLSEKMQTRIIIPRNFLVVLKGVLFRSIARALCFLCFVSTVLKRLLLRSFTHASTNIVHSNAWQTRQYKTQELRTTREFPAIKHFGYAPLETRFQNNLASPTTLNRPSTCAVGTNPSFFRLSFARTDHNTMKLIQLSWTLLITRTFPIVCILCRTTHTSVSLFNSINYTTMNTNIQRNSY